MPKKKTDKPAADKPVVAGLRIHRQRAGYLGWRPDHPDPRDLRMKVSPKAKPPAQAFLPNADTLLPPIRDQGDQGSCTGHCTRTAIQYVRLRDQQEPLELAPRFAYYNARVIEGTTGEDAGASLRNAIKGVGKLGISTETLCPYADTRA